MASAIDPTKPVAGSPTTESVRLNFAAAKSEIEVLQQTAGVGPQGPPGNTGPAGTVDIGTTTTGPAGSNATVTAAGTAQARVLNFTIPRGDSGTGGAGITETQAIDAVRQASPRFEEVPVTNAVVFPTTPNLATTAPAVAAGWALADGGDPILGPWNHTAGTTTLAWPVSIVAGDLLQFVFTSTLVSANYPNHFSLFLRTAPTVTTNQQQILFVAASGSAMTFAAVANAAFSHLVVVPITNWVGSFTLTRVVRGPSKNSTTLKIKDTEVITRTPSGAIHLGGSGKASTSTALNGVVAIGGKAHEGHTTATWNVAIGYQSMLSNSTGSACVAIGGNGLMNMNTTYCIAIGYLALQNAVAGHNVAVGGGSLRYISATSSHNTACGSYAAQFLVGGYNTACGSYSLLGSTAVGKQARAGNTALGANAGRYLTATTVHGGAENSIFIGYNSRSNLDNQTNQIVIGTEALGGGSNTITLGNGSITQLRCNVQDIAALCDVRVKDEIELADLNRCVDAVKNLPVHRWHWQPVAGFRRDRHVTGFLAGDLRKIWPHRVTEADEYLTVRDADGNPVMKTVTEVVEGDELEGEMPQVVTKQVEETVKIEGLARVELTEALPTLWGAVQRLIEMHEDIAKRLAGPEPKQPPPVSKQPEPEPEPKQPEPKHETKKSKRW